jgi:hypothetical protein
MKLLPTYALFFPATRAMSSATDPDMPGCCNHA